jgi:predicted O-linked N-acetylglucosamine transferase (SPINDLY family)
MNNSIKSFEKALEINNNLNYLMGAYLDTKMNCCNWDNLSNLLEDAKNRIIDNDKVIEPFNLMALIDNPALQLLAQKLRINTDHPQSSILPSINPYPKHQKIRIGYFSADFRDHPVAYLTAELYEVHNRDHFEIHAFSFGPDIKDQMNLRIKAGVDHFHDVDLLSHKEIVELSRSLEIDIAVDLSGFTANARTDIFAMSAAPIQLSYIGYLGTMGADYYDYLIADPIMIPKENQKHYIEKIVYLPCFQVNDSTELPPKINLTRKDLGLPAKGFIFCCFNNTYKFTPTTFDSWSRILKQVEDSVLIVFANNELSKTNLTKEIIKRGIDSKRLIFGESLDRPEYLARYRTADLFLDTQPYNAGTTASDALRMGLPMLTLKGESYQARMGASIVNALGLPELITNTAEEYESLAIELAKNPDKLKAIKDKLKANLSTAPLYNTKLFAENIEAAYTKMYERHHQGLEPDHIYVE